MRRSTLTLTVLAAATASMIAPVAASGRSASGVPRLVAAGLQGTLGSTVGPDGALYIPEGVSGTVTRIDPRTGARSTFVSGLPRRVAPIGGATDIAFLHHTAYVLVTLVSPDVGGTRADGIYRVDGPNNVTLVADIGAWAIAHPPVTSFDIPSGVQYAMQSYRGGFLVTDGHHNRILTVSLTGSITERVTLPDVVPTGLDRRGRCFYFTEAGPVPHLPATGRVVRTCRAVSRVVASGAPLLVDVELAHCGLYALSQGHFTPGLEPGSPADPRSGALLRVGRNGTLIPIVSGLDRPTSLEIIHHTAYVVTLTGEVWAIPGL